MVWTIRVVQKDVRDRGRYLTHANHRHTVSTTTGLHRSGCTGLRRGSHRLETPAYTTHTSSHAQTTQTAALVVALFSSLIPEHTARRGFAKVSQQDLCLKAVTRSLCTPTCSVVGDTCSHVWLVS